MHKKPVTIHHIARELNIDSSTVSRALLDSDRVKEKTKTKVLKKAIEMGYSKNIIASNLRKGRSKAIGLIVPSIKMYFFSGIIHGVEEILNANGYNLIICQSNEKLDTEVKNVNMLLETRVDGILISLSKETKTYNHLQRITEAQVPLVQLDRVTKNIKSSYVLNDNFIGAYMAVRHLVENGCNKIVHFSGPLSINIYKERLAGYKKALDDMGYFNPELVIEATSRKEGYNTVSELLEKKIDFDAVFSVSDMSAIGAMEFLKQHNIKIPDEVAVVGFANEPFDEIISPSLTSLEQFNLNMGNAAANLVIDQINDKKRTKTGTIINIKTELIIRESSSRQLIQKV